MVCERRRALGIFTRTSWSRTPAGERAREDLERRLTELRRSVRHATDPRDALALVAATGAAVLLADDAWPLVEDLRRRVADGGGTSGGAGGGGGGDPDDDPAGEAGTGGVDLGDPHVGGLDLGSLDLDLDLGSIGDAVDAVGAGVDAGGGEGGGDGGGGGD